MDPLDADSQYMTTAAASGLRDDLETDTITWDQDSFTFLSLLGSPTTNESLFDPRSTLLSPLPLNNSNFGTSSSSGRSTELVWSRSDIVDPSHSISDPQLPQDNDNATFGLKNPPGVDVDVDVPNTDGPLDAVSISSVFYPGATIDPTPTDLVIISDDDVFFYVHHARLSAASSDSFSGLLPNLLSHGPAHSPLLSLPESSVVLNIVLHTVYGMSCARFSPTLPDLASALSSLQKYGVPLSESESTHPSLSASLCPVILAHAGTHGIEVYALAAEHNIHALAVACSPHLLSFSLPSLTDELATRIGSLYTKKLFFLHLGRVEALKRLLLPAPAPAVHDSGCGEAAQAKLTRAWALAAAYLAWEARPDMSVAEIEAALGPLGDHLWCEVCRSALRERVDTVVSQWARVRRTI